MKKVIINFLAGFMVLMSSVSCSDYLDQVPQDILTFEDLFETRNTTMRYLATIYTYLPDEFQQRWTASGDNSQGTSGAWVAGCDEAEYVWDFVGSQTINSGSVTPETGFVGDYWNKYYKGIRTATLFMDNIHLCKVLSDGDLEQWTAEARALRAMYYYYLLRLYGPVPLVKEVVSENSSVDELQYERASVEEVVEYILEELQGAIEGGLIENIKTSRTPTSQDKGLGHIDQAVAKAFKIQTRMLAASDLFNGSNTYFANLANRDGKKLFPNYSDGEKRELWAAAAKEAKEFIDKYVGNAYDLNRVYTNGVLDPYLSYREAIRGNRTDLTNFTTGNGISSTSSIEMIFFRERCNASTRQYALTPKHHNYPGNASASGGLGASQEIVDSYFMANGLKPITGYQTDKKTPVINSASGYTETGFSTEDYLDPVTGRVFAPAGVWNAWVGREPRFYADITFDGQKWLYEDEGEIYTGLQYHGNSGKGTGNTNDYSKTGYIVRKSAPLGAWGNNDRVCIMLRLAQIYLDYAEALNESEYGNSDVVKYLNLIRERAGVPQYGSGAGNLPVPGDQASMRQAIRDERRVELAFESYRYFDIRRWCIAEETENKPIHGMNIDANGDEFFQRTQIEERFFEKKNYFFPIPSKDINTTSSLVQNPGW